MDLQTLPCEEVCLYVQNVRSHQGAVLSCWVTPEDRLYQIKGLWSLNQPAKCGKEKENRRTQLKMADFLLGQKNQQNQILAVSMRPVSPVFHEDQRRFVVT